MSLGVAQPAGDVIKRAFECRVGERADLAAVGANEMVMVVAVRPRRLEAGNTVAEVDPRDEALCGEELEDAVDARNADATSGRTQTGMQFLG